jgi:hypothetical protein
MCLDSCSAQPTDKLEDGTVSFLDIISLKHGLNKIQQLGGEREHGREVHTAGALTLAAGHSGHADIGSRPQRAR